MAGHHVTEEWHRPSVVDSYGGFVGHCGTLAYLWAIGGFVCCHFGSLFDAILGSYLAPRLPRGLPTGLQTLTTPCSQSAAIDGAELG
jgi:hypothetical protein